MTPARASAERVIPSVRAAFEGSSTLAAVRNFGAAEFGLPIGVVFEYLRDLDPPPPRSGHLGSWDMIMSCRSGATDFNEAICGARIGRPWIYAFNQTEAINGEGDQVYRPGSVAMEGRSHPLAIASWDGETFVQRDRSVPLFAPFVQAIEKEQQPLVAIHRRSIETLNIDPVFEADVLLECWYEAVRPTLRALIGVMPDSHGKDLTNDLVSHAVGLDGVVQRAVVARDGASLSLNGYRFADVDDFLDALELPFRAVSEPLQFFSEIRTYPPRIPVLSHLFITVILASMQVGTIEDPDAHPFSLHWGARAMAGWPPVRRGYLAQKSTLRRLRHVAAALQDVRSSACPIRLALLPASAMMLWPSSAWPEDQLLLGLLCRRILSARNREQPLAQRRAIEEWLDASANSLSRYFVSRFVSRPGNQLIETRAGRSVEPEGFLELTFHEACVAVGAMHAFFAEQGS